MEKNKRWKTAVGYVMLACCLGTSMNVIAKDAPKGRVIEMRADRVVIYPQRMDLKGDESLGDVLAMYPDLMQSGFDEMLANYNLRIDNVAVNGNQRIVCRQLKASMIQSIQICDNTAVAKGTTGLNRVIDITLVRGSHTSSANNRHASSANNRQPHEAFPEQSLQGLTGVEVGSDNLADHHAVLRYDGAKTDAIGIHSYQYQDRDEVISQRQNLFVHMTNYFSPKDRLLTYVSQQYLNTRYYNTDAGRDKSQNEKLLARARYFHKFNDKGTELLLVGSYQYTDAPYDLYLYRRASFADTERQPDVVAQANMGTKNHSSLFIVELNTPLTDHLNMMAGWEGDFSYSRYHADEIYNVFQHISDQSADAKYVASNNDLYLQFNYFAGPFRFTLGDRVMFYHYSTDGQMNYNETRNNVEASAVASISDSHQVQVAYHRKFINPGYSVTEQLSYEKWEAIRSGLQAQYVDEAKLGYTYAKSNFTLSLAAYCQMMERAENRTRLSASAFYRMGIFAMTAGVNFVGIKGEGNDYATFHLNPRFSLPWQMQLNVQGIFATGNRKLAVDDDVYLSGQLCKQLGKYWNLAVEWHDICSSHYSACLGTVQYVF